MRITFAASLLMALASIVGCVRDDGEKPADAKGVAEAQARLAATPDQARLWQQAAASGAAQGLEKAPVVENPVVPRPRVSVPDRNAETVPTRPAEDESHVRILTVPELDAGAFAGAARVLPAQGDRLELDLGNQRVLSLEARAKGKVLRAAAGEIVRIDLRLREEPHARREIVAVRLPDNDGILSVLETGLQPLDVKVPLFDLSARQMGKPEAHTMPVEVRVGAESRVLMQGQSAEFPAGRLFVRLDSSGAYTGAVAASAEGMPYTMRLTAWPIK